MIQMHPAVVVNAFNRPHALQRLLASLQRADYPDRARVLLLISIDAGGDRAVRDVAERFEWPHGEKRVLVHEYRLGLVEHFFACGDLTRDHASIVYLEDDVFVSPSYYAFASQALTYYGQDERIAGVSLYGLWFNGYSQQPFVPLSDDSDAFFLQVPYTQGLAFTRAQWDGFAGACASGGDRLAVDRPLHELWSRFRGDEWFPLMARYGVASDRFFVYPRVSLTTGFGDAGAHFSGATRFFQTPVQRAKTRFALKRLSESNAVYDSFFEILPDRLNHLAPGLRGYDCSIDLYASKSRGNLRSRHVLTTRPCRRPLLSFGKSLWPMEANVIDAIPGHGIVVCCTEDVRWDRLSELAVWRSNGEFFARGRLPSLRHVLKLAAAELAQKLRRSSPDAIITSAAASDDPKSGS